MKDYQINQYLADNGINVEGNTDKYYRLGLDGIKAWYVGVVPQPSEEDVSHYEKPPAPYYELRSLAYPPVGDQLDAIIKEMNYRRMNGENLTQDMDDVVNTCIAVKAKYPKPE